MNISKRKKKKRKKKEKDVVSTEDKSFSLNMFLSVSKHATGIG